jgi:hypothetical protein
MSEVNTVMHEGNVYEFNKPYMFSNADEADPLDWEHGTLIGILDSTSYKFKTPYNSYVYIKEMEAKDLGTITPAPIELIDNAPYMFEVGGSKFLGFYETSQEAFFDRDDGGEKVAELSDCTNIRPMTVAESK